MRTRSEIEAVAMGQEGGHILDSYGMLSPGHCLIIELLLDIRDQNERGYALAVEILAIRLAEVENQRDAMLASAGIQSSGS